MNISRIFHDRRLRNAVRALTTALPTILIFLFDREVGGAYDIGVLRKLRLIIAFSRNARKVEILSGKLEHLELASAILRTPPSVQGDVMECGCYIGGSSVNLSLVCAMVGRRLVICDSFAGLPEPNDYDRAHYSPYVGHTDDYFQGRFAASLDTVKGNLANYGNLDVCDFIVGFFDKTLTGLDRRLVMAFLDVDLIDSIKPCIVAIWPNLPEGCRIYVHEARSLSLVSIFFDLDWWRKNLDEDCPGFIGAGTGLPLSSPRGSELGYAQKGIIATHVPPGERPAR
jgi:O-methyltransferase